MFDDVAAQSSSLHSRLRGRGRGRSQICARARTYARSSSMATASGRHSSLGLIHTSVGDALLSGESFKYLHVSEVFVEQPKYASQSSNGTSDQKSLTTRVDFIVPARLPSEHHVGKKKKKRRRTAEVDAGHMRAPWNNWTLLKKMQKKGRGEADNFTQHQFPCLGWSSHYPCPNSAGQAAKQRQRSYKQVTPLLSGRKEGRDAPHNTFTLTHSRVTVRIERKQNKTFVSARDCSHQ